MTNLYTIGDLHFKTNNIDETNLMCESILNEIKQNKCDGIVVLGDVLDRHATVNTSVLTRAIKFLNELRKISKLYVLIGNHDLKSNDQFFSEDHPFLALRYWDNTILVDKVVDDYINDKRFIFCPYVPPNRFHEALSHIDNYKTATCIFAHQEFYGCNLGAQKSEHGDKWSIDEPFVISGHIHDYQRLDNILYIGTPIQHTYSDSIERYIGYVDFDTFDIRLISLSNVIKKKIVHIHCDDLNNYIVENDPMMKIKAKIKCEINQSNILNKHPKVVEMVKKGYKIAYEIITKEGYEINNYKIERYSVLLIDNLKRNKNNRLYDTFTQIFQDN